MLITTVSMPMPMPTRAAFVPTTPAPRTTSLPESHPAHAGGQHARASLELLEVEGAHEWSHSTRDLAHRSQQGEFSVALQGLVGKTGYLFFQQALA